MSEHYAADPNLWTWRERAEQAERALADEKEKHARTQGWLERFQSSASTLTLENATLRATLEEKERSLGAHEDTLQATARDAIKYQDEARTLRATLADAYRQIEYLHETMQEREATLARVEAKLADTIQAANNTYDEVTAERDGLLEEIEGWEQDSLKDKAVIDGLRAALEGLHFHHKAYEPLCGKCVAALGHPAGGGLNG